MNCKDFLDNKVQEQNQNLRIAARKRKHRKLKNKNKRRTTRVVLEKPSDIKTLRHKAMREVFKSYGKPSPKENVVVLSNKIGIETEDDFDSFVNLGCSIIDKRSINTILDLRDCKRLWPSAIALFCSFAHWTNLYNKTNKLEQEKCAVISSTAPLDDYVYGYLKHCKFDEYVKWKNRSLNSDISFPSDYTVPIKLERDRTTFRERGRELIELVSKYSLLDFEQLDTFKCRIIFEILNNAKEHGVSSFGDGWWIIGQYHSHHNLISICIADNGIGIKNSLLTGPQRVQIETILNRDSSDDEFIKLAFEKKVSGAVNAKEKEAGWFSVRSPRGSNRGNGLSHIREGCRICGIHLTVISHYGYISYDSDGKEVKRGSESNRVFAGTLYHLSVPAR